MSIALIDDLREQFRKGNVVIVAGSGVPLAATGGNIVASWRGLLMSGVERCLDLHRVSDEWLDLRLKQIESNEVEEFISVAEFVTERLGGNKSAEFSMWLRDKIGDLHAQVTDRSLLNVIGRLPATLIVTTNYDDLLERETQLPTVSWRESRKLDEMLRGQRRAILHLHGHWDDPESVILGVRSYHDILGSTHAQHAIHTLLATHTMLFVGVGLDGGFQDPNISAMRKWITDIYRESTHRHYALVRDTEVEGALTRLPLDERIQPVGYGSDYTELPIFLESLAPQQAGARSLSERQRSAGSIPVPPEPYYAHVYPLQRHFTGRRRERDRLTAWLTRENAPVMVVEAIGGMGKSALAWYWVRQDVACLPVAVIDGKSAKELQGTFRPGAIFWWSFYEPDGAFSEFVIQALIYLGEARKRVLIMSPSERIRQLTALLGQRDRKALLVLDGFERELRAYAGTSAAYQGDGILEDSRGHFRDCIDDNARRFLANATAVEGGSRILITTRLLPRALEDLAGYQSVKLEGMSDDDLVKFFEDCGVRGNRSERLASAAPYGNHPLAVRLLAGVVLHDRRDPGDIRVAANYPILPELKGKEKHHILQVAYTAMDGATQVLLSKIAAFRFPMTWEMIAIFDEFSDKKRFDASLDELIQRGLLWFDHENRRYDLHPVVRQHAYDQLVKKQEVHEQLRGYFEAVPLPSDDEITRVEDLAKVVELYHHTAQEGHYDEAFRLYRDRLEKWLYYRFADYRLCIDLLAALFPDGTDKWPRLSSKVDQSRALNALADMSARTGQSRVAIPLYKARTAIDTARGEMAEVVTGFISIAAEQIAIGKLRDAWGALARGLAVPQESGSPLPTGCVQLRLGWLLAICGEFPRAHAEFDKAILAFKVIARGELETARVYRDRARAYSLAKNGREALRVAQVAAQLAGKSSQELDVIHAECVLGAALLAVSADKQTRKRNLAEADRHLSDALTRCRRISLISLEPTIVLTTARLCHARDEYAEALELGMEALRIAERCDYRLDLADVHVFLGQMALDKQDFEGAIHHAANARQLAECDGGVFAYTPAARDAGLLLAAARERRSRSGRQKRP